MSPRQINRRALSAVAWTPLRHSYALTAVATLLLAGCQQEMSNQPRVEAYESAEFFQDGIGSRRQVPGTIARGQQWVANAESTGMSGRKYMDNPLKVSRERLWHGREQFEINCKHCHGPAGFGDGTVVQRGFPSPPSFHQERLRDVADGRLFEVITKGHGRMPAFGSLISVKDRWTIVAFIRALQLSQHVEDLDLTDSDRSALSALPVDGNEP